VCKERQEGRKEVEEEEDEEEERDACDWLVVGSMQHDSYGRCHCGIREQLHQLALCYV
jgi:hypothetical protein